MPITERSEQADSVETDRSTFGLGSQGEKNDREEEERMIKMASREERKTESSHSGGEEIKGSAGQEKERQSGASAALGLMENFVSPFVFVSSMKKASLWKNWCETFHPASSRKFNRIQLDLSLFGEIHNAELLEAFFH